jgi:hypothetical protein
MQYTIMYHNLITTKYFPQSFRFEYNLKIHRLNFQLFGFFQSENDETDLTLGGEDVSVFTVSKKRRVGEAAGQNRYM